MSVEKIFVTGGAGFVGSNLVRLLADKGYELTVYDNLSRGSEQHLHGVKHRLIVGDILDADRLQRSMSSQDVVIHLAAYGSVVESVADPAENFRINVDGTFSVLNAARACRVNKLIFSSTGGALIGNAEPPVDELSLPKPISPYGASKLCAEAYCHAFSQSYGMGTVCLRFANVYGPNCLLKKGVVNKFFEAARAGEPLRVYGGGTSSRDFLHVEDLCRGIAAAVEYKVQGNEVFHLASGTETSILSLARLVQEMEGNTLPIEMRPARAGEVERNFANYDKAARCLKFRPQISLPEGLARTWQWLRENQV